MKSATHIALRREELGVHVVLVHAPVRDRGVQRGVDRLRRRAVQAVDEAVRLGPVIHHHVRLAHGDAVVGRGAPDVPGQRAGLPRLVVHAVLKHRASCGRRAREGEARVHTLRREARPGRRGRHAVERPVKVPRHRGGLEPQVLVQARRVACAGRGLIREARLHPQRVRRRYDALPRRHLVPVRLGLVEQHVRRLVPPLLHEVLAALDQHVEHRHPLYVKRRRERRVALVAGAGAVHVRLHAVCHRLQLGVAIRVEHHKRVVRAVHHAERAAAPERVFPPRLARLCVRNGQRRVVARALHDVAQVYLGRIALRHELGHQHLPHPVYHAGEVGQQPVHRVQQRVDLADQHEVEQTLERLAYLVPYLRLVLVRVARQRLVPDRQALPDDVGSRVAQRGVLQAYREAAGVHHGHHAVGLRAARSVTGGTGAQRIRDSPDRCRSGTSRASCTAGAARSDSGSWSASTW